MNIRIILCLFIGLIFFSACQEDSLIPPAEHRSNEEVNLRADCCGDSAFAANLLPSYIQDDSTTCCVYKVSYTASKVSSCDHFINTPSGVLTYEGSNNPVVIEPGETYIFKYEACSSGEDVELSSFYYQNEKPTEECAQIILPSDCLEDCCTNSGFKILTTTSIYDPRETCCRYEIRYSNGSDCEHKINLPPNAPLVLSPVQAGESTTFSIDICSEKGIINPVSIVSFYRDDPINNQCDLLQLMPDCTTPPPLDCCYESGFNSVSQPITSTMSTGNNICCNFNIRYSNGSLCTHQIFEDSQLLETILPGENLLFTHTICKHGGTPEENIQTLHAVVDDASMTECDAIHLLPSCVCFLTCDQGFAAAFAVGRYFNEQGGNCIPTNDYAYNQTLIDYADCPEYLDGFLDGWLHGCNNPGSDCLNDCDCDDGGGNDDDGGGN